MEVTAVGDVPDGCTVLIDTNPIIYVLDGHSLAKPFEQLFADIEAGRVFALVTPITLAEVVAGPLTAGNESLVARYRSALTAGPGWRLREIDADIAVLAARLRARHRLRLPDALQLAVAIDENCYALVTHDRDFRRVKDVRVLGVAP
jgi:predicted nucleic acid-binding protein